MDSHAGRELFPPLVVEAEPLLGDAKVFADCLYHFQEQFPDGEDRHPVALRGVGPGALFAGWNRHLKSGEALTHLILLKYF
jgi:hypothetical protein